MDVTQHIPQLLLALMCVLVMVYGIGFLARRSRLWREPNTVGIEIVSSTYLSPKEKLLLLRVHDREILIGMGPQHMCALSEFSVSDALPGTSEELL